MKLTTLLQKILPALFTIMTFNSHAQQEFTLTTSAANVISSKALIDLPGLTGNPLAIIVATPLGNTKTLNPHPTGAWYYSGKWNIFNCDQAPLIIGLTYKVQYFLNPGPNQFLHLVTLQNLGSDGSYIDNPGLNNKPNVQFSIFQNHSPDTRPGSWLNPNEAIAAYNAAAGKWYITNAGGQPLQKGCAYNIVISSAGTTPLPPVPIDNLPAPCKCPASLPPNGDARGDLIGTYPNPMVAKILGRPLSNTAPVIGQILKWNGTEWSPTNEAGTAGNNYTAGLGLNLTGTTISANSAVPMWNANKILGLDILTTPPTAGQVLKFGGGSWYPADDNVGVGGINNPESWKTTGANISNTNTGYVGIGNNNPAYQLDINNRMRIRSGGNSSATAGLWLNNNANTEAAFMGMEDDTHVGFYGSTSGWKFGMNTQTGALKINGTEGTTGQVLTSNGAGSPPTWNQPSSTPSMPPMQTFFKKGTITSPLLVTRILFPLIELNQNIVLTKKSRLIISASVKIFPPMCSELEICYGANGILSLEINSDYITSAYASATVNTRSMASICNYMVDLTPGTYSLEFKVYNDTENGAIASPHGISRLYASPTHSSVIVIPLE